MWPRYSLQVTCFTSGHLPLQTKPTWCHFCLTMVTGTELVAGARTRRRPAWNDTQRRCQLLASAIATIVRKLKARKRRPSALARPQNTQSARRYAPVPILSSGLKPIPGIANGPNSSRVVGMRSVNRAARIQATTGRIVRRRLETSVETVPPLLRSFGGHRP